MSGVARTADAPDAARVSWRELLTREHAPALLIAALGVWLHAADGLVVATMTPAILTDIGGGALIAWTLALYEVGSISAGALSGLAAARHGVRRPMALAATVFALGCVVSALAPSMPVLLAGRLLQGFGGGGLVAFAFVVATQFFSRRLMPRVLAVISLLWGVSAFIGPMVGGVFVEYGAALGGWRGGFMLFAIQAAALCVVVLRATPEAAKPGADAAAAQGPLPEPGRSPDRSSDSAPWRRVGLIAGGVVAIAAAGIDVTPVRSTVLALAGALCFWMFLRLDAAAGAARMLPRRPATTATPAGAAALLVFFFCAATISIAIYGPLLMIRLHGVSAFAAGYILALGSISWTAAAVLVSGEPERRDPLWILVGVLTLLAATVGFLISAPNGPVWLIGVSAMLEGGGFGLAWTFILRRATALSPEDEAERLSAGLPTVQRLGYAVGAAAAGIVANGSGMAAFEAGDLSAGRMVGQAVFAAAILPGLAGLYAAWRLLRFRRERDA